MQKRGFGDAARSPEAFQAQSSACCQYMHVAAGMHAGRGYFRAKSGAYTHGCEQGNNHNASAIHPTDGPWRGETKTKHMRFHFLENPVSIDTVCAELRRESAVAARGLLERDMRDSDKLTAAVTALTEGGDHSSPLAWMARSVQVFALPPNRKSMSLSRL